MINSYNSYYNKFYFESITDENNHSQAFKKQKIHQVDLQATVLYKFLFNEDEPHLLTHIMQFVGIETSLPVVAKDKFKWQHACNNNVQYSNQCIQNDPFFVPYLVELEAENRPTANLLKDLYLLIYKKVESWEEDAEEILKKTLDVYQSATHPNRLKELILWNRDQNLIAICPALGSALPEFASYYQELDEIPNDDELCEIKKLSLKAGKIRQWFLDSDNQQLLATIQELDLKSLNLNELPFELFFLIHLSDINLSDNRLSVLPPEISNWKNLIGINLSFNCLSTLPTEIECWVHLNTINLDENGLTCLAPQIKYWTELQHIYLNENKLTYLPPEIAEWKQLRVIQVYDNNLTSLPKEIGSWTNLISFFAGHNNITQIPAEVAAWTLIQIVNLEENKIKSIGSEITTWTNLTHIKLNNNRIKELTPAIGRWIQVEEVDLNNNLIENLPEEAVNWTQIKKLGLANNKLSLLTIGDNDWVNLEKLDLQDNYFTSLPIKEERSNRIAKFLIDKKSF